MSGDLVLRRHTRAGVEELGSPSMSDVLDASERLDGVTSSELSLADEGTTGIHIVGGPDRFVCWVQRWDDNDELVLATATDPNAPAGTVSVTLSNGQVDDVDLSRTIDASALRRAVRTYVEGRGLDASVTWDRDPASW